MGKKHFTFLYIVSQNKYKVNTTIFVNIKVNSFTFINTTYIIDTAKFLNIKAMQFKKLILIKGYNS